MKEKHEKIYTCMEHVEQAIDDYVNYNEAAPQLNKADEEEKCAYCQKTSEYLIK
ncbi:MAG: CxxH/CxxC protein [Tissierellia bacterium]|jgi:CxxH/CxxC protein (TIGR04129 family)|nr:CxxH/CxxC protein [Tissierellia bacterium]